MVITALIALCILGYTYVGYPILIAIVSRLLPRRTRSDPGHLPTVTALMSVYNAEAFIAQKLDSLLAQDYPSEKLDIIVCSDGSTDATNRILSEYAAKDSRVTVMHADRRGGKPRAINLMRPRARGDVLLMTDVRQPLSPDATRKLVNQLADPRVGCASGELALAGESGPGLYWKYESMIRKAESRFRSLVGVTGALYVIRKEDLPDLPPEIVLDDMWVPMRLRLQRKRIVLVPGAIAYDQAFEDAREWPRKVRTLAGNYQLFAMMPRLLIPLVNPSWFETMSHKVMRLLCPWALLALWTTTLVVSILPPACFSALEVWGTRGLFCGQVAFYFIAGLGKRGGRLGGVARTFVILNTAAVLGLWRFLSGRQRIAW